MPAPMARSVSTHLKNQPLFFAIRHHIPCGFTVTAPLCRLRASPLGRPRRLSWRRAARCGIGRYPGGQRGKSALCEIAISFRERVLNGQVQELMDKYMKAVMKFPQLAKNVLCTLRP